MGNFQRYIRGLQNFLLGHYYVWRYYDKKYTKNRWFGGKCDGLCSRGWKWIVDCARGGKALGNITQAPWPVDPRTSIVHASNIEFDYDDLNIFQSPGCYFQAHGKIVIGKGTWIAPNVGLITSNHDLKDLNLHYPPKDIIIGENCWIGMNSMVLPGVHLGSHTVVGAGSVVTHSFPEGDCVIAGNPARVIRKGVKGKCE